MDRLRALSFVLKWRLHDRVKFRSRLPTWMFLAAYFVAVWRRWDFLLAAHRQSYNRFAERRLAAHLPAVLAHARRRLAQRDDLPSEIVFRKRAIVLKTPQYRNGMVAEKGVLLVKFTNSFAYLYRHYDVERLLDAFHLVLEPSRSGYAAPEILVWAGYEQPVLVQASERRDQAFLERLGTNVIQIGMGSSDWVDHRTFHPLEGETKQYDSVLVGDGTFSKRIHVYLRAVAELADPGYRAALVLNEWGDHTQQMRELVRYYGLEEQVTVFGRMTQEGLNVLFNQSKVNVLLSLKEGSNRVLFEGFFAGTPGLLLDENVGVNKTYLNEATGRVVSERHLSEHLSAMKQHWQAYRPREWAMEHISYQRSTQHVASAIATVSARRNMRFTGGLYEKVNSPEVNYPDDPSGAARERLLDEYLVPFERARYAEPAPGRRTMAGAQAG